MSVYNSPEIVPALDESRPQVGPNLADDEEFCREVAAHVYREYAYPQMLQQWRLQHIWRIIDDAYRVKGRVETLDISFTDKSLYPQTPDGKGKDGGMQSTIDPYSAKVQPAAVFKQIKTKTDMHMSIAYADGLPVRAVKPETVYDHPIYNTTQQQVDTANELLRQCARETGLATIDRKGRGCWSKYGFVWAATDFQYELEDVPMGFRIPPEPQMAQQLLQAETARFGGIPPKFQKRSDGMYAVWEERVVKTMRTNFIPLRHDDVFIDLTLSSDIQRQPCPCVRQHGTKFDLLGNEYNPETNPFGWLNVQKAFADKQNQYTLSATDEIALRQELTKKWGMSSEGLIPQKNAIKQRWTCYPRLAIYQGPDGKRKLDKGDGLDCPTCNGRATIEAPADPMTGEGSTQVPCPQCQGAGRIYIQPERHVVEIWGLLMNGGAGGAEQGCVVLRIQRNPDPKDKIPLIFGAHLIEDDAGAIPMSVVEASMSAWVQLATAHNQYLDWKNKIINPPWTGPADSPYKNKDLNRVNGFVGYETRPDEHQPMNMGTIDATNNLIEYAQWCENQIQQLIGMTDQLLGMISPGRRAATEIQTAFDAAKLPVTVEIDSYNRQVLEPWAQAHLDNIEAWADRDWIRKKTGTTTFGKVQLFSAVADEFMKRMGLIQNYRYFLELAGSQPGVFNVPYLAQQLAKICGLPEPDKIASDGGLCKAQLDAAKIVARILGDGVFLPPDPSDPDDIFIVYFQEALKDENWMKDTPETMPLLQQRLMFQQMQQQQKQMMQMQMMMQQQALMAPQEGGGNGNQPPNPNKMPQNKNQANQQLMGAQQS